MIAKVMPLVTVIANVTGLLRAYFKARANMNAIITAPSNSTNATDQKVSPLISAIIGSSKLVSLPRRNALTIIKPIQAPST